MNNSAYLFNNKTTESQKKANELKEKVSDLLKSNEFPFELKEKALFMVKNAGVSGLNKMLKELSEYIQKPKPSVTDTYIVLFDVPCEQYNKVKELGFKTIKINDTWIRYRKILSDKFDAMIPFIKKISSEISMMKSTEPRLAVDEYLKYKKEEDEYKRENDGVACEEVVELKKWYARTLKESLGNEIIYRNIKITKKYAETSRAVLVDFEFFGGISVSCGCCGLPLDNEISKACGIGPVCATKIGLPRPTMENAKEILVKLNEKMKELKNVEKIWIPKSQIKGA